VTYSSGSDVESPRLSRLSKELLKGCVQDTREFWQEIEQGGSPLIEIPEGADEALVTFLWHGGDALQGVAVIGPLVGMDSAENQLTRMGHADIWYKTYRLPLGVRGRYWFSFGDPASFDQDVQWEDIFSHWARDPLNPNVFRDLWYVAEHDIHEVLVSILGVPPGSAVARQIEIPEVGPMAPTEHQLRSELLRNERRVWVYTPFDCGTDEVGVVVFLDGHAYLHLMSATRTLDTLIGRGLIPPLVAVFVDSLGPLREVELPCNSLFADFLADELLPWISHQYAVSSDPGLRIIVGSSYGGLAAAFAALRRPDAFGNVLSQSGSFWWRPDGDSEHEFLARQAAESSLCPIRFSLDVGLLETEALPQAPSQLLANRHLRTVLRARGYHVDYMEFLGSHDEVCWSETLSDGLVALASSWPNATRFWTSAES